MAENPTKGGVHHSAFLSRKTAPAAPSFHVRDAKVVKNRAENQLVNISSHSAKNRSPTLKSPRIPHVAGDCVRRRSNNLLGQFRKITTDFRRTFSHKIPLASQNHLFPTVIGISENDLFLLTLYPIVLIPPNELHQLTRIYRSKQTFFDFFSQNRGYFPLFLLINKKNTISCRSRTAHPQRLRALLTGHNIYMYQIYRGTHRGAPLCVFTIQSTRFHSIFESRICK